MDDESLVVAPDTTNEAPAPVVAPDAPVVAPAPVDSAAPVVPETRHDTLRRALNTPNNRGKHAAFQPREAGKFAGAPIRPAEQNQAPTRAPMIKSLRRELEPHWNTAHPELVNAFVEREAAFEKGATEWKTKAQQADSVLAAFQPYEQMLRNEGATPQSAIGPLLQTAAILRTGTPAQKAQSVAQVMQQYGIPLEHIAHMFGQAQTPVMDPHYNQLAQQVQQLTQAQQYAQQSQQQRALSVIEQFAKDPANAHFAALQPKMLALLQTPDILGPDIHMMSEREKLDLAYKTAIRLDPQLSAQVAAQQQAAATGKAQAQAAVSAAKRAAVSVTGAPGASVSPAVDPNNRRATIANALRAAQA